MDHRAWRVVPSNGGLGKALAFSVLNDSPGPRSLREGPIGAVGWLVAVLLHGRCAVFDPHGASTACCSVLAYRDDSCAMGVTGATFDIVSVGGAQDILNSVHRLNLGEPMMLGMRIWQSSPMVTANH